jgi:phosphoribosylformimino-5-aminoimidazole carboxamide ribotide isomerase
VGLSAEFRPCIDLHDGKVKQIVGSTLDVPGENSLQTNFVSAHAPEYYAALYRQDNLSGGHVIQLGSGNQQAALAALGAWPGGLQLGGGVTDENAAFYLDAGAAKVIVTSFVFSGGIFNLDNLKKLLKITGPEKLVLDLSCRRTADGRYFVVTDRWRNFTELEVSAETLDMFGKYCSEFLIHAVDVEGKQSGIDRELLDILSSSSSVPCVYAGGISSWEDIETIESAGRGRIHYTVGSALDIFGGKLPYQELVRRNVLNQRKGE